VELEQLKAFAVGTLDVARKYLAEHDEYDPQLVTINAGNEMEVYIIVHPRVPPWVVVRQILRSRPATAFILTAQAWTIRKKRQPGESESDLRDRIKRGLGEMPANWADYGGPDRTEGLVMWVCSRDYMAMHTLPFTRAGKSVHFENEMVATNVQELSGAFVEMRELLQYLH